MIGERADTKNQTQDVMEMREVGTSSNGKAGRYINQVVCTAKEPESTNHASYSCHTHGTRDRELDFCDYNQFRVKISSLE